MLEAKHWFGLVFAGLALIGVSFATNQYKEAGDIEGARPLSQDLDAVDAAAAAAAPAPKAPAATRKIPATPKPKTTKKPKAAAKKPQPEVSEPKPAPATESAPVVASGDGPVIVGRVKWSDKKVPKNKVVRMSSDPVCVASNDGKVLFPKLLVDDESNVENVIVYIDKVPKGNYWKHEGEVLIDQKGCMYVPNVVGVQLGQKVVIRNSDNTTHNVHWKSKFNDEWNMTQSTKGDIAPPKAFARTEIGSALFKCDIHPWMEARVGLFDHPYFAVSKANGTFEISTKGLPAGTYTLKAWHQKYKTAKTKIKVTANSTITVDFSFNKKKKNKAVVK